MKYPITRFALIALLGVAVAACDDDDDDDDDGTGPQTQFAQLRVVNATEIADVQARLVGATSPFVQDLDFRGVTQTCAQVPEGERAIIFSATGIELATTAATFERGESYTAFLVSSNGVRRAVILPDSVTASTGNNALRFINSTNAAGDVYVTAPGGAVTAGFLAAGNLAPLGQSNALPDYVHRSTAHTQVRLFNTGAVTNARSDITLTGLPTSRLATVVFTNAGTPAGPTAFQVTPCS
jgi:hypothetical protein